MADINACHENVNLSAACHFHLIAFLDEVGQNTANTRCALISWDILHEID